MAPSDSRSVNRCGHGHLACKLPINVTVPFCDMPQPIAVRANDSLIRSVEFAAPQTTSARRAIAETSELTKLANDNNPLANKCAQR